MLMPCVDPLLILKVERLRSELRVSKPKLPAETLAKLEELRAEAADIERDSPL